MTSPQLSSARDFGLRALPHLRAARWNFGLYPRPAPRSRGASSRIGGPGTRGRIPTRLRRGLCERGHLLARVPRPLWSEPARGYPARRPAVERRRTGAGRRQAPLDSGLARKPECLSHLTPLHRSQARRAPYVASRIPRRDMPGSAIGGGPRHMRRDRPARKGTEGSPRLDRLPFFPLIGMLPSRERAA